MPGIISITLDAGLTLSHMRVAVRGLEFATALTEPEVRAGLKSPSSGVAEELWLALRAYPPFGVPSHRNVALTVDNSLGARDRGIPSGLFAPEQAIAQRLLEELIDVTETSPTVEVAQGSVVLRMGFKGVGQEVVGLLHWVFGAGRHQRRMNEWDEAHQLVSVLRDGGVPEPIIAALILLGAKTMSDLERLGPRVVKELGVVTDDEQHILLIDRDSSS